MNRIRLTAGLVASLLAAGLGASAAGSSNLARIPDGVYRANVSEEFLRAAGVPGGDAAHNGGIQMLIFKGKRWTNRTTMNRFHPPDCSGDLSYSRSRVTLILDPAPGCSTRRRPLFSARWSYKQGQLRFAEIQPTDLFSRTAWGGKPWKKIG
jgi:hypothetical protein